jgi:RNA polymerase-binding transcription factor DksA
MATTKKSPAPAEETAKAAPKPAEKATEAKKAKAAPPAKAEKRAEEPAEAKPASKATAPKKAAKPQEAPAPEPAPAPKAAAKKAAKAPAAEVATAPAPSTEENTNQPVKEKTTKKAAEKPVKVPKISATGKVPYEPDFTHSVLDTPKQDTLPPTPSMRYSDSELAEFRELINRKLESAKKELSYLQGLITRKDDMGGDNDDARYMTMEDGSLSMEREQLSQMASRQITFIDHLEKALMRIENKTYGICRVTGRLIDKARLRAVPHATLSMEAKMGKAR